MDNNDDASVVSLPLPLLSPSFPSFLKYGSPPFNVISLLNAHLATHSVEDRALRATTDDSLRAEQEVEDKVFQKVYIPRTLDDVVHLERDLRLAAQGKADQVRACVCVCVQACK